MWDESSVLSASVDKSIRFWDIKNPDDSVHLKGHGAAVTQIKRLNNSYSRAVSSSLDGKVKIWEIYSGECLHTFDGHSSGVNKIAMN